MRKDKERHGGEAYPIVRICSAFGFFGPLLGPFSNKNASYTTVEGILAEGTRFELVVQNNPYGSLANCWFQPLTHPSGLKAKETHRD